jgi:hypothetical protein
MATAFDVVFLPFRSEEKKAVSKVSKLTPQIVKILSRFSSAAEAAVKRQLSPGDGDADDGAGDGGLGGHPDYDDADDGDIATAMNHLIEHNPGQPDAMSHVRAAHEALSRIVERHGKPTSPHAVRFAFARV